MQAQTVAMGALNLPSAADIERLTRRLRSVSQRLEGIEDGVERLDERLADVSAATDTAERLRRIEEQLRVADRRGPGAGQAAAGRLRAGLPRPGAARGPERVLTGPAAGRATRPRRPTPCAPPSTRPSTPRWGASPPATTSRTCASSCARSRSASRRWKARRGKAGNGAERAPQPRPRAGEAARTRTAAARVTRSTSGAADGTPRRGDKQTRRPTVPSLVADGNVEPFASGRKGRRHAQGRFGAGPIRG